MATTLITEKMRNPQDNGWIPLRKIIKDDDGFNVVYLHGDTPVDLGGKIATFNNGIITKLEEVDGLTLTNAEVEGTIVSDSVDITGGDISNTGFTEGRIFDTSVSGGTISDASVSGGSISNASISGGSVSNVSISGGSVSNASISGGSISGAGISGGSLSNADITGGTIADAAITGGSITSNINGGTFTGKIQSSATIAGGTIANASLAAPTFTNMDFAGKPITINNGIIATATDVCVYTGSVAPEDGSSAQIWIQPV